MRAALLLLVLAASFSVQCEEWLSGTWIRAERKLDRALEKARTAGDGKAEARLLAKRASLLLDRSSYHRLDAGRAERAIGEARAAAEASGDRQALASAIQALARWH